MTTTKVNINGINELDFTNGIASVSTSDGVTTLTLAAGGSVTSVALTMPAEFSVSGSPVTTTGTLDVSKATQNANLVYAGPGSGSAAAPTFRSMVADDLPLATTSAFGAVKPDGSSITISGGVISATSGGVFGNAEATFTDPTLTTFTNDNFSGSTNLSTITPGGVNTLLLSDPGVGGNTNTLRSILTAIPTPASPWTLTARLRYINVLHPFYSFGLILKDSVSGKYMIYGWGSDTGLIQEIDFNNANSFANDFTVYGPSFNQLGRDAWWQFQYDGTNLNYNFSADGNAFSTLLQTAIGSIYLPNKPDSCGIGFNANNTTAPPLNAAALECFSFKLTQP